MQFWEVGSESSTRPILFLIGSEAGEKLGTLFWIKVIALIGITMEILEKGDLMK